MTQIPAGTKFIGISASYPTTERKSALNNSYSEIYTIEDIAANSGVGPQGIQGPAGPQGEPGPVGPAGLNWQGQWVSGTSYVEDDAVGYDGASWFCILATSGTTNPSEDATHWALLASQGATGATGATGAQGPMGPQGPAGTATMPYRSYVAILDFPSVIGPITATVLQNDFTGITFTWSISFPNLMKLTPSDGQLFSNTSKTVAFTNCYEDAQYLSQPITFYAGGGNYALKIITRKYDGTQSGSFSFSKFYVEVRVYN
jgi:hypothetical protein